jgi:hypothetical protein
MKHQNVLLLALCLIPFMGFVNSLASEITSDNVLSQPAGFMPEVRWTAGLDMDFRLRYINNMETKLLYEATTETGTFTLHAYITYFHGVLFASWDVHARDENASGQHGVMRRSMDHGGSWTAIEELFPPLAENVPAAAPYPHTRFHTNNGFAVVDNVLYAISDVAEWSAAGASKVSPRVVLGRMARSIDPEGGLGELFWLLPEAPLPIEGFPYIPAGNPVLVNQINHYLTLPGNEPQLNFGRGSHPTSDDNIGLGEPVPAWQLDNGTWVKLYRAGGSRSARSAQETEDTKPRRKYASFSFDDGKTWTVPTRTNFTDAGARTNSGKLPDGQVYVINNLLPISPKKGGRVMLAISLSRDGLTFDRATMIRFVPSPRRYEGRSKSMGYMYPESVVVGEYLLVIYSINKEDVELARIPIEELYKL